ncbi:MAG: preprotein translocase subunit SecG [Spiroplasma sp.]|nr:preprotein translocase subunit SecG [Spiroplasma sp.]
MNQNIIFALEIILFIMATILVLLGLLQGKKNHNGLGALSGGNQELFASTKERGWIRLFSIITLILGILLFITAIVIRILINTIL